MLVSEAIYKPTYPTVCDVIECDLQMVFFTLPTVIDLQQGKKVKYNLSNGIVYALGIGNMLEIIV